MQSLALDQRFDGILAWDSFFHLTPDDQKRMFAVFAAHANPRAALMFTSGHVQGEVTGHVAGQPVYHASLAPATYQQLLKDHGFRVIAHKAEDPTCGNHTIWLAQYRP